MDLGGHKMIINQNTGNMKTTAKQFTAFGNTAIVQLSAEPFTNFSFYPGAPEIASGGLRISEATESGVVAQLLAVNLTDKHLLLTDSDILVGARQNRIINKAILLAPGTKTTLDVSCVERLRWRYTSRDFSGSGSSADPSLRKAKAEAMAPSEESAAGHVFDTQSEVWEHISSCMRARKFSDATESYHEFASHYQKVAAPRIPVCDAEPGCNALAVFSGGQVQCIDIFGNTDVYNHYFPLLRDAAFRMTDPGANTKIPDRHEAFFKVLDLLDGSDNMKLAREEDHRGAGEFLSGSSDTATVFSLLMNSELIHRVIFKR